MSARLIRIALICGVTGALLTVGESSFAVAHSRRHSRAFDSRQCPNADARVRSAPLEDLRAAVLCLTNQERNAHGLPGLRASARLDRVAQGWTRSMVGTGAFSHGANFTFRFSAVGYDWRAVGENIATGYPTPRAVVAVWMASPDHCRNILDPSFRDIGIGAAAATVGGSHVGPGTWVEDFGLRMSQSAPSHNTGAQSGCPYG